MICFLSTLRRTHEMADVTSRPFPDRKTPAGFRDASAGPTGFRTGSLYAVWIVRVCSYALCALTPPRPFTHQTLGHPPLSRRHVLLLLCLSSHSVNAVVPKEQVLSQALAWARDLVANSPDAVQSTKRGIVLAWQHGNVETATLAHAWAPESKRTYTGENIKVKFFWFPGLRRPRSCVLDISILRKESIC